MLNVWTQFSAPVAALLSAFLVLAAAPLDAAARQQKPQPAVEPVDLAKRIHALINSQRKKHGLQPLSWDEALSRIAAKHSQDMSKRNYLGHDTPEGKTFSDRYRQDKFSCEIRIGNMLHGGSENIALSRLYNSSTIENNITYYDWNSAQQIATRTVDGWMKSPGHRKNILTPHWRREGIGIKIGPGNKVYITQNFC